MYTVYSTATTQSTYINIKQYQSKPSIYMSQGYTPMPSLKLLFHHWQLHFAGQHLWKLLSTWSELNMIESTNISPDLEEIGWTWIFYDFFFLNGSTSIYCRIFMCSCFLMWQDSSLATPPPPASLSNGKFAARTGANARGGFWMCRPMTSLNLSLNWTAPSQNESTWAKKNIMDPSVIGESCNSLP